MLRSKRARGVCKYGCCSMRRRNKPSSFRRREERAWRKDQSV